MSADLFLRLSQGLEVDVRLVGPKCSAFIDRNINFALIGPCACSFPPQCYWDPSKPGPRI